MRTGGLTLILFVSLSCAAPATAPPQRAHPTSPAAATWDGGIVTAAEVRAAVHHLSPSLREQFDTAGGRQQFIDALVAKRLMAAEARRLGLDQQPELRAQVSELEERLLIQALLTQSERAQTAPGEDVLRKYYGEHEDAFRAPPAVHVARVLIRKGPKPAVSKTRLEQLRQRLVKREAVAKVAAEGDGAERVQGGDLGWFEDTATPVGRAGLALTRAGEISPVLELDDAWACVVLIERREARLPPFEEVRQQVASRYAPLAQRAVFDSVVKKLFTDADVHQNPGAVE